MNNAEEKAWLKSILTIACALERLVQLKEIEMEREKQDAATKCDLREMERRIGDRIDKLGLDRADLAGLTKRLDRQTDSLASTVAANQPTGDSGALSG